MGFSTILLKVCLFVLVLEHVRAERKTDDKYKDNLGHLKRVPRRFEIRAENAIADFKKYIQDIQDMLAGKNVTVLYKVKVELLDSKNHTKKRKMYKKMKSKKYNVPLKKQSMKLSNFEVLLRKLAEENGQKIPSYETLSMLSTEKSIMDVSTKQIVLKYKPIRQVKTNFTKIIKPVRNNVITLTT